MDNIPNEYKKKFYGAGMVLIAILSVYFIIMSVQEIRFGSNKTNGMINTFSVSGQGEVSATPDIATISFTIKNEAKTVAEAQTKVAETEAKALEVIKANEVDDKDVKTVVASFNPKYEYKYESSVCNEFGCTSRPGKNTLVGYEAYETITVKVRNIDSTPKIIEELGKTGITNLTGPNFTIDQEDELKAQARKLAIEEAQDKAEVLAKDLGVKIKGVSSFYEQETGYYPSYDMAYGGMEKSSSSIRAELPKGENTITSNVTITYEIK